MDKVYFLAIVIDSGFLLTTVHRNLELALEKFQERNLDSKIKNSNILCLDIKSGVAMWIWDINKVIEEQTNKTKEV